jgi:hypothetical protein
LYVCENLMFHIKMKFKHIVFSSVFVERYNSNGIDIDFAVSCSFQSKCYLIVQYMLISTILNKGLEFS